MTSSFLRSCRFALLAALLSPLTGGAAQEIARTGDPAVGLSGATYYSFDPLAFTDTGALLFGSRSQGLAGAADGLWQWTEAGGIEAILLGGDETSYGSLRRAVANDAGDFAYEGRRLGPPAECDGQLATRDSTDALWFANAGSPPVAVWTTGDLAPGAPDSLRFLGEADPYRSRLRLSSDTLVFAATLAPDVCPDPPPIERSALFHRDAAGVVRLVAVEDAPAPDAPDDASFAFFSEDISIHSSGRIVFGASLVRREDFEWFYASAIYRYDPIDGLVLIAIGPWNDDSNGIVYSGTGFGGPWIDVDGTIYFSRRRWENLSTVESELIAARPFEPFENLIGLGDPVPGVETSTVAEVGPASLNGAGDVALVSSLTDEVDPTRDWAILEIEADGTKAIRLRAGDAALNPGGGWLGYPPPQILRHGTDGSLLVVVTEKGPFIEQRSLYRLLRDGSTQRLPFPGYQTVVDPSGSTAVGVEWDQSSFYTLSVTPVPEAAATVCTIAALASLAVTSLTTARKPPPA